MFWDHTHNNHLLNTIQNLSVQRR
uniref:Uncharacterized protein n=1 Tax=Arundo donax TaxID=35708 RepID=A0A0A9AP81_ARUDO